MDKGLDVVGFDISPLSIGVCRRRGARNVSVRSITQIGPEMGAFDTIVMLGSNFGLLGGGDRAKRILRKLRGMTSDTARIVAATRDPYFEAGGDDLEAMKRNERRGKMPGQWRIRIRYRTLCTPWFDYLTVSPEQMEEMLDDSGWSIARVLDGPNGRYTAILDKQRD